MPKLNLATASYREYDASMGVAVGTSVGKYQAFPMTQLSALAPYGIFNVRPRLGQHEFHARYLQRLDAHGDTIVASLTALANANPRRALVLLCWCRIGSDDPMRPDGFCHRRMAAGWLERRLGVPVPELTLMRDQRLF